MTINNSNPINNDINAKVRKKLPLLDRWMIFWIVYSSIIVGVLAAGVIQRHGGLVFSAIIGAIAGVFLAATTEI